MNYKEYKEATNQQHTDPTEWNDKPRYCEICDVEESKTYFVDDTAICESCHDEIKKEDQERIKIAYNKTNFNINTKL